MKQTQISAKEILGNPEYQAISYGGYRTTSRRVQPTVEQLKEDMHLLSAMGIKVLRTYNIHMPHAINVLKAIDEIQQEDPEFEMYVMLGAWIDCKNAWTGFAPIHHEESERNAAEIERAVDLANKYPHIIKMIAVGNEAMVKWAAAYYVEPWIILKWVKHLQELKTKGTLAEDVWITSSDNFASWGGGGTEYHLPELEEIMKAVDFLSIHTYPMHDTHYNPVFWHMEEADLHQDLTTQVDALMSRSVDYAKTQYKAVKEYTKGLGIDKPIHIGETGWASFSIEMYGDDGTMACDQYKQGVYYQKMRQWTNQEGISCFFFEAFDEPWKDSSHPGGSENHFGLFNVEGEAKYAIWDFVDRGAFTGLSRDGHPIQKSFFGKKDSLLAYVKTPTHRVVHTPITTN